jgi:hypothetical protein
MILEAFFFMIMGAMSVFLVFVLALCLSSLVSFLFPLVEDTKE